MKIVTTQYLVHLKERDLDLLMFLSVRRSNVFNIQHSSNRLNLYPLFGKDKNLSLARELTHAMGVAKKNKTKQTKNQNQKLMPSVDFFFFFFLF